MYPVLKARYSFCTHLFLDSLSQIAFERHSRAKRARVEATNAVGVEVQSEYHSLQKGIASTSKNIEAAVKVLASEVCGPTMRSSINTHAQCIRAMTLRTLRGHTTHQRQNNYLPRSKRHKRWPSKERDRTPRRERPPVDASGSTSTNGN